MGVQTQNMQVKLESLISPSKRQKTIGELKSEIMMSIPPLIDHAVNGCVSSSECKLNSLLLDYFIQNELRRSTDDCSQNTSETIPT